MANRYDHIESEKAFDTVKKQLYHIAIDLAQTHYISYDADSINIERIIDGKNRICKIKVEIENIPKQKKHRL